MTEPTDTPTPRGWKAEVLVDGTWSGNGLVFSTRAEALTYGENLAGRWTLVRDYRATVVDRAPTHAADEYGRTSRLAAVV